LEILQIPLDNVKILVLVIILELSLVIELVLQLVLPELGVLNYLGLLFVLFFQVIA
jgi:hypothetical protein